jgi:hypothetical protein
MSLSPIKPILLFSYCVLLFSACGKKENGLTQSEVLISVKDWALTREEVRRRIPKGISLADSLIRAENIVKKWAIDILMDEVAYQNVGNEKAEIEQLVNEYRRSLIRHRFQERLVKDRISAEVGEEEQLVYYEEYKNQFVLNENLIKGLFLKVPVNAPGLNNVRKWYVSDSEDALEKIEKYSIQNAMIYDYFYDHWVTFDDVMAKIPYQVTSAASFLRTNTHLEISDSTCTYFLNISDRLLVGSIAPFDYVRNRIQDMLVNKRKVDYLKEFGETLYVDAVKNGTLKLYTQ